MTYIDDTSRQEPDINALREQHKDDPGVGQGFNDQRGENPDPPGKRPTHKNIKNNLGPEEKKPRQAQET